MKKYFRFPRANFWAAFFLLIQSAAVSELRSADLEERRIDLNGEWEFRFEEGKSIEQAFKPDFESTGKMAVPGCYDAVGKFRFKRGTGLYRRSFTLARDIDDARLVVDGMGLRGEFFIDGRSLGTHPYPYAKIELEAGSLKAGRHVIAATIDNRLDWKTMKLARPFYDFYFFGGFYRGVSLEWNTPRVFVRTLDYRTGEIEVEVEGEGKKRLKVPNFKLWSPEEPNLTEIEAGGRKVRFGIRQIEAKNRRLYLNGKPVFLKGVNRHEQSPGKGVTMTEEEMVRDLKLLKSLGANFIRGAHYQQHPRFLDLCDEMGFLVWEESLGWGNGQSYTRLDGINEFADREFAERQIEQTRMMVRASFNHPSVVIYGFLNECASDRKDCKELVDKLIEAIRREDSGRLITFACNIVDGDICNANTDLVAFNAYPGTIPANPGTREELAANVARSFNRNVAVFRSRYPDKPILVSESGCSGFYGMRDPAAPFGCEDFQNEYLTDIMETLWANDDVAGFSIWQFADTVTHQRNCGRWSGRMFGMSMAGIFDARRRPKMSCETVKKFFKRKFKGEIAPPEPENVPALLRTFGGSEVKTADEWEKVRAPEILDRYSRDVFGVRPKETQEKSRVAFEVTDVREAMDGKAVRKLVNVNFRAPEGELSFPVTVFIPKSRKPVPAFVFICNRPRSNIDPDRIVKSGFWPAEEIVARGFAAATFQFSDVVPDDVKKAFSEGLFAVFGGEKTRTGESWAAISAWAWAASRVLDWMETEPLIDAKRVGVVGHSRGGKTALWAGATDRRFAMVCSNDSGCSGAKLNHINLPKSETIAKITKTFPYWFCGNYAKYAGRDFEMDFDQHELLALVAPRLLCVASATNDDWAGQPGEWWAAKLASPAWELYGRQGLDAASFPPPDTPQQKGFVSYHIRTGSHDLTPYDWKCYMDFAVRHGWTEEKSGE